MSHFPFLPVLSLLSVLAVLIGTPLFALFGVLALALFHLEGADPVAAIIEFARLSEMPSLIAIPLFTFAGYLLAESGAPQRTLELAESLFGWMRGGVAIAALCACALFTAFTGASGVTIIALGGLVYPLLKKQGYSENFALGLVTTSGSLGLLFPPSLPIILYAIVAQISLAKLFAASLLPGLLLLAVLAGYASWSASRGGVARRPFSAQEALRAVRRSLWEIPLPFVVIGGIYLGKFTAGEAAAVMAFYLLAVELFVYRDVRLKDLPRIVADSQILVGAILLVLGCAMGLTSYMIDAQIPSRLFAFLSSHIGGKFWFLALLNAFLLMVNMVEIFSAIVIMVPLIVPIAASYGIDPFHLGVVFLLNLEIGYLTPPMGLNLFLSSRRFDVPFSRLYRSSLPFWGLMASVLAVVTYWPPMSLWLPKVLGSQ